MYSSRTLCPDDAESCCKASQMRTLELFMIFQWTYAVRAQNHVRAFKIPSTSCVPLCVLLYSIVFAHKLNACPTWKHLSKFTVQQSLHAAPVLLFCSFSVFPALTPSAASLTSTTFSTLAFRPWGQLIECGLEIEDTINTKGWYCWNDNNSYMSNSWKKRV